MQGFFMRVTSNFKRLALNTCPLGQAEHQQQQILIRAHDLGRSLLWGQWAITQLLIKSNDLRAGFLPSRRRKRGQAERGHQKKTSCDF